MFKNIYFYRARLFPAVITSIPMLIFFNKIPAVEYNDALKNIYDILPIVAHLGLSTAVIFLCIQINRLIAKEVFQRMYFKEELFMPTTTHIMVKSVFYAETIKNKIRSKIEAAFSVTLLTAREEQQNETNARKLIATAVSQIRIALKGNTMLLQHNIEYGFWRNLIGGSLVAVIFSAAIFFYGYHYGQQDLKAISIICLIIYAIPIFLSKLIINYYGKYYSKILYEQFLSLP
ncbi:MAG: hypothetical protein JWP81_2476 [Ferruginibacter sp.]|nr:hypothetical protein [Ferruginibacter sp.]